MPRTILHSDLNNFFASVECAADPALWKVPMAVCGSVEERHGIVLAKNPLARQFGVKTAEAVWQAKQKCPSLVTVAPHYDRYVLRSRQVREIYGRFTDQVEPFSIDECWLDVSGSLRLFGCGTEIARRIQHAIKEELGLGVSIGVSFNKTFSKLGSELCPPEGICEIPADSFARQLANIPASELLGAGPATVRKLSCSLGIFTIGQLASAKPEVLQAALGKNGLSLWRAANGLESSPVLREEECVPVKSMGNSITPAHDIAAGENAERLLLFLCDHVTQRLREQGLYASSAFLSLRDTHLRCREYGCRLSLPSRLTETVFPAARELLRQNSTDVSFFRSMGLRVSGLTGECESFQVSFYQDIRREQRAERLAETTDELRKRFGQGAVIRASLLDNDDSAAGCRFSFFHS